ncbi:Histamine H2 receptor [Holothuria leucospilota]|uniref:Histamine H2 receptor n=1 Tax=Holothuria leucospilota TaxID=206669 RepID=A0A9Q1CJ49_HOLLE|nr:Histamine H2 receptor [Holothuria leucospilota]
MATEETSHWVGIPQILRSFSVTVTGSLCIILNSINILILQRAPHSFGETTSLILTLMAVNDVCTGFTIVVTENFETWSNIPINEATFCNIAFPLKAFFVYYSLSLLGVLNLDRLILVTRPLRYFLLVTRARMVGALILAALMPSIIAFSVRKTSFSVRNRYCRLPKSYSETTDEFIISMVAFYIMILVLFITYANFHLLFIACRHRIKMNSIASITSTTGNSTTRVKNVVNDVIDRRPSNLETGNQDQVRESNSKPLDLKGLRTVLMVTFALYLAAAPYFVRLVLNVVDQSYVTDPVFEFCGYIAGYSNSWWNPLIYLMMNSSYRNTAKRMFASF